MHCVLRQCVTAAMFVALNLGMHPLFAWQENEKSASAQGASQDVPRIAELLDLLAEQNANQDRFKDPWSHTLKEIIETGPSAVPQLIAELDATNDDMMLRCMGFTLRAIGDKRAIPALIRAIPKTLKKPGSDMGLRAADRALKEFMQKHDNDERDEGDNFSFGRPIREIMCALQKLSGHSIDDDELFSIFTDGTALQRRMKEDLFYRHAQKWAKWWEQNAASQVKDAAYLKVNLPPKSPMPQPKLEEANLRHYRTEGGSSNWILESYLNPKAKTVFLDFDTGRRGKLPEKWRNEKDLAAKSVEIEKWAGEEGFDLMGSEYISPASGKKYFALIPIGLKAWELGEQRWKMESPDITFESLVSEGKSASGWLLHRNQEKRQFVPEETATFLFRTKDGTPGLLFVGIEVQDDSLKPGGIAEGDHELRPIHFFKGRRFGFAYFEELTAPKE